MNGLYSQILLISPEPWDGHFVSKHHYAITLASRGHKVYFLNPPNNSLKRLSIEQTKYKNLWQISAPQVAKGLRFYPKILRNYVEHRWLERLEKSIGSAFTTVWLFENSRFYAMDFARDRTKIYHQVDANQNFHVKEAAKSADLCFCTTDYIKNNLLQVTNKVHKIHHGVTLNYDVNNLTKEQLQYFDSDTLHAVYIGNLDISYFDIEVFTLLVRTFPNVTFHLVGNFSKNKTLYMTCEKYENIKWWGRVDSYLIPTILAMSDIQLLLYKSTNDEDKKQLASPHKLMEYLASGKVTVATYTDEYKDKRELLEMVDDSREYLAKFTEVVNHLEVYNSKEKQKQRVDFAKEHSYEKQLDKIITYLKQYNLKL